MKFLILSLVLLFSFEAFSYQFKIRAREHFDWHTLKVQSENYNFFGLSNTFNFWWEKPRSLAFGFSINPVLAARAKSSTPKTSTEFGGSIKVWNVGLESKYFPFQKGLSPFFIRPGAGWTYLDSDGQEDNLSGYFLYLGLGVELEFKYFNLALEAGYRLSYLQNDVEIQNFTPSIGFHVYSMH